MHPNVTLPPFNYHGYLPQGVHATTLEQIRDRFVINPRRTLLWERLQQFLGKIIPAHFSQAYIDGGFITNKASPEDIDVILQTRAPYGPEAFDAVAPFYAEGIPAIFEKYSVHLHFSIEGSPSGVSDFRLFFQYIRPQDAAPLGLKEGARKGIVVIQL